MSITDYDYVLVATNQAIGLPVLGFNAAFSPVPLLDANGLALIAYNAADPLLAQAIPAIEELVALGVIEEITEAECVWMSGAA